MMDFRNAPQTEWRLNPQLEQTRKERLLGTSFDSIVELIVRQADLHDYECEKVNKVPGSKRIWISLIFPPQTIDLNRSGFAGGSNS
jgi:hypothetical protein